MHQSLKRFSHTLLPTTPRANVVPYAVLAVIALIILGAALWKPVEEPRGC